MLHCASKGCQWFGPLPPHRVAFKGEDKFCGLCMKPAVEKEGLAPPEPRRDQDALDQEELAEEAEAEFEGDDELEDL